ncbi:hypothetical protein B0J14DRAFT_569184 [Halenospora varia]|nr:hypothetical protein B0J14DRAFT_569184 [Halenospora varia]
MSKSEAEIQHAPAETFERSPSIESGNHASADESNVKKRSWRVSRSRPNDRKALGQNKCASRILGAPDGSKIDRGYSKWKRDELVPLLSIPLPPGAGACRVIIGVPERGRLDRSFAVDTVNLSGERAKGILRPIEKQDFQSIRKPGFDLMRLRQTWSLKEIRWQPFCYSSFRSKPSEEMGKIDPESIVVKNRGQTIFAVQPSWAFMQTVPLEGDRFIVLCALPSRKLNPEAGPKPRQSFSDLKDAAEEQRNEKLPLVSMDFSIFDFLPDPLEIQANANTVVPLCFWMRELKDTAHHLLATLTLWYTLHSPSLQNVPPWLPEIEMELQADINHSLSGFQALRERMLSTWAQVDASMKQATEKNLGRLTMITAIFLPLSYRANILGMQFRIRELHFIFYDYLGLVVASGLFCFLVYTVIPRSRLIAKFFFGGSSGPQRRVSRTKMTFSLVTKGYFRTYRFYMLLLSWIVIAVSFLIGMIGDMPMTIKALKYGLPVVGGICIC